MGIIIALKGVTNSGKSMTFRMLHDKFFLHKKSGYTQIPKKYEEHGEKDFLNIFEKNKKKIGITSAGDTSGIVSKGLIKLINYEKCEIIICTCHPWGGGKTVKAIFKYRDHYLRFIQKNKRKNTESIDESNEKYAIELFKEVEELVNLPK